MKCYFMDYKSNLQESLDKKKRITQTEFNKRLGDYTLATIDENFAWYIIKDRTNGISWLLMEINNNGI